MFERLLAKLANAFANAHIPYMVIGGQAVLLYGEPRLTKDIDITLGVGLDQYSTITKVIESIPLHSLITDKQFTQDTMVLPCHEIATGIRVDLIFSFSPYEQEALKRINCVYIGETDVCFASLEDLIIHKIIAGRPRDLEDIQTMLLKNPHWDQLYVQHWLQDFSQALNEPFWARLNKLIDRDGPMNN